MVEGPNALDELHDQIFGASELGPGKRYERLAALVFRTLGEEVVRFDVRERGPGRRTKHQIDVWVERAGAEQHLIVECKHWSEQVGKGAADTLVGVRDQLKAAGAILVTTVGYTKGARDVAFDENLGLLLINRFDDPEDWRGLIKEVRYRGSYRASSVDGGHDPRSLSACHSSARVS